MKGRRHAQHLASVVDEGKEEEVRVADDVFSYHNVIAKPRDLEGSGILLSDPMCWPCATREPPMSFCSGWSRSHCQGGVWAVSPRKAYFSSE